VKPDEIKIRTPLRVLLLEDRQADAELMLGELRRAGFELDWRRVDTEADYLAHLTPAVDAILADFSLPQFDAMRALQILRQRQLDVPFIVVTGSVSDESAVECMKQGASDYLLKDRLVRLGPAVQRALQEKRLRDEVRQADERIHRQVNQLQVLRTIDLAITGSVDLRVTLNILLEQATSTLGTSAASVHLLNPHTQTLEFAAGRGFRTRAIERSKLRLGEGLPGRAMVERQTITVANVQAADAPFARATLLADEQFVSYCAAPLLSKGRVEGVLEIFDRAPRTFDAEWLGFLEAVAGQAAIAIENAALFDDLQRSNMELRLAYDTTLEGWSRALDLRDKETEGHTQRVTELTLRLARIMELSEAELVHVRRGALLHDIGKMGIPDAILLKPGPLTDEEWQIMRRHPVYAYEWLSPIRYLQPALDIPYCHHERWDGTGYPRGLKSERIPLAARIFAVPDVYDALTSERPYRPAWAQERALSYIRDQAGTQFDRQVVETFLKQGPLS
jgi:putative nucleotidyltransferase with HDIG domain